MDIKTPLRLIKYKVLSIIAMNSLFKNDNHQSTIFVDVTEYHLSNGKTGIQRVTENVLNNLKKQNHFIIKTVYAKPHNAGFYYTDTDKPISISANDIFFGLDLSLSLIPANIKILKKINNKNIPVYFFIHDLIPIYYPETVSDLNKKRFPKWLTTVVQFTGIISNSKATMNELQEWLENNPKVKRNPDLELSYVHLGCNFTQTSLAKTESPTETTKFLMVSTVEPRKRYDLAVKTFEILWKKNINVQLSIVGRKGWNNEETINLIETSEYLNKKLFWYNSGISDQELTNLYKSSNAVLVTSIAEGFGLCLAEAAYYNKPIICRNLPVFREIANDNAFYFETDNPEVLAARIEEWISLYKDNNHPKPFTNFTTWEECTSEIFEILTKDR